MAPIAMSRTFSSLAIHLVFRTLRHEPSILSGTRIPLHKYLYGIARNLDCETLAINGTADHVHLLVEVPPRLAIAELVRTIKCNSSTWVSDRLGCRFRWQAGYGAFAVSRAIVPRVRRYIDRQEEHHRRGTYREELERFLREAGFDPDPRFTRGD
jgi:putative transposase